MDASTEQLHKRYKLTVIYHLPHINYLDTQQIGLKDRKEAMKRGKFLIVAKPSQEQLKEVEDVIEDGGAAKAWSDTHREEIKYDEVVRTHLQELL